MIARQDALRYYRFTPLDVHGSAATILGTPHSVPANGQPEHHPHVLEPASFDAGYSMSSEFSSFVAILMAFEQDRLLRVTASVSEITAHYKRRLGLSSWFFDIIELLGLHRSLRAKATLVIHATSSTISQVHQDKIRIEVRPSGVDAHVFILTPSRSSGSWDLNKDTRSSSIFSIVCCTIKHAFEIILNQSNAAASD